MIDPITEYILDQDSPDDLEKDVKKAEEMPEKVSKDIEKGIKDAGNKPIEE